MLCHGIGFHAMNIYSRGGGGASKVGLTDNRLKFASGICPHPSKKVRHQGGGLVLISGVGLAELGTHPVLFQAELGP